MTIRAAPTADRTRITQPTIGAQSINETTTNGILKSANGGEDWFQSDEGFPRAILGASPSLAIDPQKPDIGYASVFMYGPSAGTYKTTNGGKTWSQVHTLGREGIVIDPMDPNTIYVGDIDGVAESIDGAATWFVYRDGLDQGGLTVREIAIDPQNSQILYAATSTGAGGGVFNSIDGGESWFATAATLVGK